MAKILVVDDEKDITEVVNMYLEDSGHDVTCVTCAQEALSWSQENQLDLLITDILMPNMSGLELITEILKDNPKTKILAISGGGESGGIVKDIVLSTAADLGAQKTLTKPFTKEELIHSVERLL